MTNQLSGETSPYLLQHADNPVHWQPWSEQALAKARERNQPLLVSIGYSACHWCHVMAHECFEDPGVAAVMNQHFINVKVDREERPDLDQVYQTAHQILTGRPGGWPLTVFLTSDGMPFFAGTYFPREPGRGLPGFADLCLQVAEAYRTRGAEVAAQNSRLAEILAELGPHPGAGWPPPPTLLADHRQLLLSQFDARLGGFGGAPKFPHAPDLQFLLDQGGEARDAACLTLRRMAEGGLFDQLAGGFFRYCVDADWQIPHFEKMLYDNALLLPVYASAWRTTGEPLFAAVVSRTVDWLLSEMALPEGGFASSLDADAEGEEGAYYVWRSDEVRPLLSEAEWALAATHWGFSGRPNFEGRAWHLRATTRVDDQDRPMLDMARRKLLAVRRTRVAPGRDDKVLTAWNALLIDGLVRAAKTFERPEWLAAARQTLHFLRRELLREGRLLATWRGGRAQHAAYLDDHAFLLSALAGLLDADFRDDEARLAAELAATLLDHFEDHEQGGFWFTADDHEVLIHRAKPVHDQALPAGNAVAARALLALGDLLKRPDFTAAAERTLRRLAPAPRASGGMSTLVMALGSLLAAGAPVCTIDGACGPTAVHSIDADAAAV
jgi:uncharacterized protein YyaL (SSP411 family)